MSKFRLNSLALVGRAASVLLILAILMAGLPQAQVARAATCSKYYTVVSGDTLSKIADDNNVTVQEMASANNLKEPYTIYVSQVLCIPGTPTTTTSGTTSTTKSTKPSYSVSRFFNVVSITITNYPSKTIYWIKAKGDGNAYRLGFLRTDKAGSAKATYRLPRILNDVDDVQVCLKNPISNGVLCKDAVFE